MLAKLYINHHFSVAKVQLIGLYRADKKYLCAGSSGADHSCSSDFQPDCQKYYAADPEAS
jgi:hypothetical protein